MRADRVADVGGRLVARERVRCGRQRGGLHGALSGERALEEQDHLVERVGPGIALVGDVPLEEPDRGRFAAPAVVLDRRRGGRDVLEAEPREEAGQLRVRVRPRLDPAEELQHQALPERDRGVGLLGAERHRLQPGAVADQPPQLRRPRRCERARPAGDPAAAAGDVEEPGRKDRVGPAVEHDGAPALGLEDRNGVVRRPGVVLRQRPDDQRDGIRLRLALGVLHPDEAQVPALPPARAGDPHRLLQRGAADPARLAGEPAPRGQEPHQGLVELAAAAAIEDRRPPARDPDLRGGARDRRRLRLGWGEREDVEVVGAEGERVEPVGRHGGEHGVPEELLGHEAVQAAQVELDVLRPPGQVRDDEDALLAQLAQVGEHLAVVRKEELERPAAEGLVALAQRDHALHPPEQRVGVRLLGLDVHGAVLGVADHRQIQLLRVGPGEAGVSVGAPLHRRADAVSVAQVDVVAHAELVAVVDDGRPGQREQERVHELDHPAVVAEERREPAADAQVDARLGIVRVGAVHVVALLVGDHLERQLVVVSQEDRPLAALRDRRGLGEDVDERIAVLHPHGHEHARHEREVEGHVALVAVAEVGDGVLGPLVRLGEQHPVGVPAVDVVAQPLQHLVGLGQVLAVRPLLLVQVGHGVEAQPVDAHVEPEVDDREHRPPHLPVLPVQVGLVGVEPVPVVGPRRRVPRPVGALEVAEDDARVGVRVGRVAPHVEVARPAARLGAPGPLEPRVHVGGVVQDELGDDAQPAAVRGAQERPEVAHRPVVGVHLAVGRDVVPVVAKRRGVEGQEPDRGDAEVLQVVEPLGEAAEVADAVAVRVGERPHVQLVDDRVLVPVGDVRGFGCTGGGRHAKYSKSCSLRRRRRTWNRWAGTRCGSSST